VAHEQDGACRAADVVFSHQRAKRDPQIACARNGTASKMLDRNVNCPGAFDYMTTRLHIARFLAPDFRVRGVAIGCAKSVMQRPASGAAVFGGRATT
jgi:hypothetical protein